MPVRSLAVLGTCAVLALGVAPASAAGLDDLKGAYAFDWHIEPASTTCEAIGDALLARLKSAEFACDLTVQTNSASGHPVRVCTAASGSGEYLIFDTRAFCEEERETQASNE